MRTPAHPGYLQEDEKALATAGRAPWSVVDLVVGTTFAMLLGVSGLIALARFVLPPAFAIAVYVAIGLVLVLWVAGLVAAVFRVRTSRYTLTDTRVYRSHGRWRFDLLQTTYDKVTDLHVRQGIFGRFWGYGTVTLRTAGAGLRMEGVHDPFAFKRRLEQARSAFFARLLEEFRAESGSAGAAPADLDTPHEAVWTPVSPSAASRLAPDTTLWSGGPVPMSLVGQAILSGLFLVVAAGMTVAASVTGGPFIFLALFAVVAAVAGFFQVFVAYRYTRYLVTPAGVVVTAGWLTRRRVETTFDKVTDVTTYEGLFGRLLGYGNITLNTAGSNQAPVVFRGVGAPQRVKTIIDETRRAGERRRTR